MDTLTEHRTWWIVLSLGSLVLGIFSTDSFVGALGFAVGHLFFSALLAGLPWLVYRMMKRGLNGEQLMSTYTVCWVLFALPFLFPAAPSA